MFKFYNLIPNHESDSWTMLSLACSISHSSKNGGWTRLVASIQFLQEAVIKNSKPSWIVFRYKLLEQILWMNMLYRWMWYWTQSSLSEFAVQHLADAAATILCWLKHTDRPLIQIQTKWWHCLCFSNHTALWVYACSVHEFATLSSLWSGHKPRGLQSRVTTLT